MVSDFVANGSAAAIFCTVVPVIGWLFSVLYYFHTKRINVNPDFVSSKNAPLSSVNTDQLKKIWRVYTLVYDGAHAFLYHEYIYIGYFIVGFSAVLLVLLGLTDDWTHSLFTTIAFIVGSITSVLSGYIGMKIGVFANARTAIECQQSLARGFTASFKAAVVMGFCLCAFGIFNLFIMIIVFKKLGYDNAFIDINDTTALFEAVAGYGLGGSSIALFGRVGGGIYTKAADVGADLVGKNEAGLEEDDIRNPAVIADNVGDNVGDIAGMGADLFGSFAESSCAALVIAAQTSTLSEYSTAESTIWQNWGFIAFPLVISCTGMIACLLTSFLATHVSPPRDLHKIEPTLKLQLLVSTIIETILMLVASLTMFPESALFVKYAHDVNNTLSLETMTVKNWHIFLCLAAGLWCGLIVGYITEYYTSNRFRPVQEVAVNCTTGAATNIIIGLALGYKSVVIPIIAMALATFVGHSLAGFYGVALNAIGILSTLSIGLTIDAFGPISDNAGGIAEMCDMGHQTRQRTDALDAAGNTTAAIGKGFAIGSAAFVSLALFSGYMTLLQAKSADFAVVDMLHPFPFAGLLVGAMIPYWFSAMTMAAVGRAAGTMVSEVRRQFETDKGILLNQSDPDYARCIQIATEASLREMIPPGILVMGTPIVVGFLFGCQALAGCLLGALVSGVQIAISASNTGGAWDNAKKFIEQDKLSQMLNEAHGKKSPSHVAAVIGDTVGDPLKDTSGPSINIVMKLMAVESLVLSRAFYIDHPGFFGWLAYKI